MCLKMTKFEIRSCQVQSTTNMLYGCLIRLTITYAYHTIQAKYSMAEPLGKSL